MELKETGIVRRIDDLGRVVIPKQIRHILRMKEGDPLELFISEGRVVLQKYRTHDSALAELSQTLVDSLYGLSGCPAMVVDRENVIAFAGERTMVNYVDCPIGQKLTHYFGDDEECIPYVWDAMGGKVEHWLVQYKEDKYYTTGQMGVHSYMLHPIIDHNRMRVIGAILVLNQMKYPGMLQVLESRLQFAAEVLGRGALDLD